MVILTYSILAVLLMIPLGLAALPIFLDRKKITLMSEQDDQVNYQDWRDVYPHLARIDNKQNDRK